MRRIGKTIAVWTALLLTAVDPVSAGRWHCRSWAPRCCYTPCCPPPCTPCVSDCSPCGSDCSPCGGCSTGGCVDGNCASGIVTDGTPVPSGGPTIAPAPSQPQMAPLPSAPAPAPTLPAPSRPTLTPPAPAPAPSEVRQPPMPAPTEPALQETPAPEPPALEEMPEETPPAAPPEEMPEEPAAEPAEPAKPSDDVDDLFKETEGGNKTTSTPAETEPEADKKPGDDVDDLFKETEDNKAAAKARPAMAQMASDVELENLFVEPAPPAPVAKAPAVKVETKAEIRPALHVPARPAMRTWTDNTGRHEVSAVLVSVSDSSVRLLKDTGKYTTVPFYRLSADDLDFVRRQTATTVAEK